MNKLEMGIENIPQELNQDNSEKPNIEQETESDLDGMADQEKSILEKFRGKAKKVALVMTVATSLAVIGCKAEKAQDNVSGKNQESATHEVQELTEGEKNALDLVNGLKQIPEKLQEAIKQGKVESVGPAQDNARERQATMDSIQAYFDSAKNKRAAIENLESALGSLGLGSLDKDVQRGLLKKFVNYKKALDRTEKK
ncbi:MAG: hypothetical protein CMI55_03170 [Parcubacteria group bacterium]|nr:hypothetical protein [Parcubacteria group bacterium]|tara:strand:+ start:2027 stop:2620 length:594 start_codon:yes stop_codon:yes gene_type:complete